MRSLPLGHVANINEFISNSISPITTKQLDRIEDQNQLIVPCRYDDIIKTRSRDKFLFLISISTNPTTTKLTGEMISLQWSYFTGEDDATITRSHDSSL